MSPDQHIACDVRPLGERGDNRAEVGEGTHFTDVLLSEDPFTRFLPIVFWLRCLGRAYL
jgi:hypothetical protein